MGSIITGPWTAWPLPSGAGACTDVNVLQGILFFAVPLVLAIPFTIWLGIVARKMRLEEQASKWEGFLTDDEKLNEPLNFHKWLRVMLIYHPELSTLWPPPRDPYGSGYRLLSLVMNWGASPSGTRLSLSPVAPRLSPAAPVSHAPISALCLT